MKLLSSDIVPETNSMSASSLSELPAVLSVTVLTITLNPLKLISPTLPVLRYNYNEFLKGKFLFRLFALVTLFNVKVFCSLPLEVIKRVCDV